jgi:amino acid transporter
VQNAFNDVVDVSGLLFGVFYIFTALATVVFYRRLVFSTIRDAVILGILPLASAAFLAWIVVQSVVTAPASQIWSCVVIVLIGLALMVYARWILNAPFFHYAREQYELDRVSSNNRVSSQ